MTPEDEGLAPELDDAELDADHTPEPEEEDLEVATWADLSSLDLPEKAVPVDTPAGRRKVLLRALPAPDFDALVSEHPPIPGRDQTWQGIPLRWNPERFQPALVAACMVEPDLSESEVTKLFATWNKASTKSLFDAALDLNEEEGVVDLGKSWPGFGLIPS